MSLNAGEKIREGDFIGLINMWGGSAAPTGWLLCDGAAISRTTYSKLFAILGTTYGVGDGSTTFNVPNLKGKVPVGKDAAQTEFDTLGEAGGEKTHVLTTPEMPAHTHRAATGGSGSGNFDPFALQNDNRANFNNWAPESPSEVTGGGGAHNNLQPYVVVNFIIKASQAA